MLASTSVSLVQSYHFPIFFHHPFVDLQELLSLAEGEQEGLQPQQSEALLLQGCHYSTSPSQGMGLDQAAGAWGGTGPGWRGGQEG